MAKNKRPNPRNGRDIRRRSYSREVKQSFLIICEGVNTEPDYFNAFRLTSANVKAVGRGVNTIGLVTEAIRLRHEEERKGHKYDQCWVVFDKDDFPDADFDGAIRLAESNSFKAAYSNQAFEYWFLLHFHPFEGQMHRSQYSSKLTSLLGIPYSKQSGSESLIYGLLAPRQTQAIANAKNILDSINHLPPSKRESSTTVHLLVEELNKFI